MVTEKEEEEFMIRESNIAKIERVKFCVLDFTIIQKSIICGICTSESEK
jgi:hypothetical protein